MRELVYSFQHRIPVAGAFDEFPFHPQSGGTDVWSRSKPLEVLPVVERSASTASSDLDWNRIEDVRRDPLRTRRTKEAFHLDWRRGVQE